MEWADDIGSRPAAWSYVPVQFSSCSLRVFYRTLAVGKDTYLTTNIINSLLLMPQLFQHQSECERGFGSQEPRHLLSGAGREGVQPEEEVWPDWGHHRRGDGEQRAANELQSEWPVVQFVHLERDSTCPRDDSRVRCYTWYLVVPSSIFLGRMRRLLLSGYDWYLIFTLFKFQHKIILF